MNCPPELEDIRAEWQKRQNEYGDVGCCVIGAGFEFEFGGTQYRMPPQGYTQGSCSWEASKDDIGKMLIEAGCNDVSYDWGRID